MTIGILHFTDLHFNSENNIISSRIENFYSAVKLELQEIKQLYIVISGDVVNKGNIGGYQEAKEYLEKIKEKILQVIPLSNPKFVIVPGNHDCNFDYDNQLRKNAISSMGYETIGVDDNSVIDICTNIQNDFWEFYKCFNEIPQNKLFYQIIDTIGDKKICFNCINSSWMSKQQEEINLFFPIKRFDNTEIIERGTINISIFHHPISWFTPNGKQNHRKEFQGFVEDNSSIIIYGHEHEEDHRKSVELLSERETLYFSGKILQNPSNKDESGFQIITIDPNDKSGIIKNYLWNTDIFKLDFSKPFKLNGDHFGHKRFKHNIEYLEKLNALRIPIKVENKSNIKLSDFYVFPDLDNSKIDNKKFKGFYDSENLINETKFNTCIIEGENQAGKTSLISMLYRKFVEDDKYPLFVDCKSFKKPDVDIVLEVAFKQQYNTTDLDFDRFTQFDKSKKVVLIDNLQNLKFNPKTINQVISDLEKRFYKVIIVTNTLYGLLSKIESEFDELKVFTLRPLGYKKRNKLIENYHKLNLSETTGTNAILLEKTKHSFNQVETVLGNELMPSYPVFVLSILQTPARADLQSVCCPVGQDVKQLAFSKKGTSCKLAPTRTYTLWNNFMLHFIV